MRPVESPAGSQSVGPAHGEVVVPDGPAGADGPLPDVSGLFGSTRAWALDDTVVHANHGSFGGLTTATTSAVEAARRAVEANPMETWARRHDALHEHAVGVVADWLGARRSDLALVANATVGVHVALQVLPWRRGARILHTDHAYPSVLAALRRRATTSGAQLVAVDLDPTWSPGAVRDRLVDALDDVDGLVVDAVSSATATWCDVDAVVAAARDRDVVVVVDGAHEPGQVELGLAARGADAWVGNLHKWACAPKSVAALVVDPRHHDRVAAAVPSWYDDEPFPGNTRWQGTGDLGPVLVAEQVVLQARAVARQAPEIEARVRAGADHVAAEVGGRVLPGAGWMRSVVLPGDDDVAGTRCRSVEDALATRGVEAKLTPVRGRAVLRLSAHAYTSARDHDRLADGLADALVGR